MIMYSLELSLRYSPFPLSIQKKEFDDVIRIYDEIKSAMNETLESSNLIELRCDKVQDKRIAVRAKEIISVQIYEKETSLNLIYGISFSRESRINSINLYLKKILVFWLLLLLTIFHTSEQKLFL